MNLLEGFKYKEEVLGLNNRSTFKEDMKVDNGWMEADPAVLAELERRKEGWQPSRRELR